MALTQKRIRELTTYSQLNPGDPGYVAPSSLFLVLDSGDFGSEPLKYPGEDFFSAVTDSRARVTGLSSANVSITFATAFSGVPLPVLFHVYRYVEVVSGKWQKQDVQFYYGGTTWLTSTGFDITIESSESLTGVIMEYYFIGAS